MNMEEVSGAQQRATSSENQKPVTFDISTPPTSPRGDPLAKRSNASTDLSAYESPFTRDFDEFLEEMLSSWSSDAGNAAGDRWLEEGD